MDDIHQSAAIEYSQVPLGDQEDQDDPFVPVERETTSLSFAHRQK